MSVPDLWRRWCEHNRTELHHSEEIFAFDCDQTLINGDIGEATLRRAIAERWIVSHNAWWAHLSASSLNEGSVERWRLSYERESSAHVSSWSKSLTEELWEAYVRLCDEDVYSAYVFAARLAYQRSPDELSLLTQRALEEDPLVSLRPVMADFVSRLEEHGEVWVVSSSHVDIVRVIAAHYKLSMEKVVGIDFERDSHSHRYIDSLITPAPIGPEKIDALRLHTSLIPRLMVGDSRHDLPLMKHAQSSIFIDHHHSSDLSDSASAVGALVISASDLCE